MNILKMSTNMITEAELHDYNKWLMEVWNPNQLYIPFEIDAPKAYLRFKAEQLNIPKINWGISDVIIAENR